MRRVVIINTSSKIGGAEKSLIDVVKALRSSFFVLVVLPNEGELFHILKELVNVEIINVKRFNKGSFFFLSGLYNLLATSLQLAKIIKSNNIGLIYSNSNHAQVYGIFAKILTRQKLIWHVRDSIPNKLIANFLAFPSNKILCVSRFIYNQVSSTHKSHLIYNGVSSDFFNIQRKANSQLRKELKLDEEAIVVAQVGSLIPWKKHDLFIKVAACLRQYYDNVYYIIIGGDLFDEYPKYKKVLKEMVEECNLSENFAFIDYKYNIEEYLAGIDVLVHLAFDEPFGRVLIEAMSLEKPVIAFNKGAAPEIIAHNSTGFLVSNSNVATFAHKLRILIDNPELRVKFGKGGRKLVKEKFSIDNLSAITEILNLA